MRLELQHNLKRRKQYITVEQDLQLLKWSLFSLRTRIHDIRIPNTIDLYEKAIYRAQLNLMLRKANYSISKIKNVCYVSRRNRGVSRAFRLSRQTFKEQVQKHQFIGVTRFPAARG